MKHNQEYWKRNVDAWRTSNLSQRVYCQRHHLPKGTFGYWVSKLKREGMLRWTPKAGQRPDDFWVDQAASCVPFSA
jgi:hypothetical protein